MSRYWRNQPNEDGECSWDENQDHREDQGSSYDGGERGEGADYWAPEDASESEKECCAPYADFTDIPAWHTAHVFALKVAHLTRGLKKSVQRQSAVINLRRQSYLAAVDIAAAHDEGYHATGIQQQLVRQRRSLKRLHLCLGLIDSLQRQGEVPSSSCQDLFNANIEARDNLVAWMERLRNLGCGG